jgi:hypothetical protein
MHCLLPGIPLEKNIWDASGIMKKLLEGCRRHLGGYSTFHKYRPPWLRRGDVPSLSDGIGGDGICCGGRAAALSPTSPLPLFVWRGLPPSPHTPLPGLLRGSAPQTQLLGGWEELVLQFVTRGGSFWKAEYHNNRFSLLPSATSYRET